MFTNIPSVYEKHILYILSIPIEIVQINWHQLG